MPDRVRPGAPYLRRNGRSFVPVGAHLVPPEGPDWPWRVGPAAFDRGFAAMAAAGMTAVRIDLAWAAVEPAEGSYDEDHLRVLDEIVGAAGRHGLLLHPALLMGGEVGDAFWDVPWRAGRHPHRDGGLLASQAAHVGMLARRWAGDPRLLAWDLTDEPPFWPFGDTTDGEARAWTGALAAAIRAADPGAVVTVGTAGQDITLGSVPGGRRGRRAGHRLRPPLPDLSPGPVPGRPAGLEDDARGRVRDRARGGGGPSGHGPRVRGVVGAVRPPADRRARSPAGLVEPRPGRGGVLRLVLDRRRAGRLRARPLRPGAARDPVRRRRRDGAARPRGTVLAELAATVARLDLDGLAGDGPAAATAILVPHEYARPYDAAALRARTTRRRGSTFPPRPPGRRSAIPCRSWPGG